MVGPIVCPVCGVKTKGQHRCNKHRLKRIEAEYAKEGEDREEEPPSIEERLRVGFEMLGIGVG